MSLRPPKRNHPGLAERAKAARTALGLSQQVTATRAGMSMNRLRDVERYGLATPDTLRKLSSALSVDFDVLTGRKEAP